MNIFFQSFTKNHLPHYNKWIKHPHVKNTWFLDGYETEEAILDKIEGNGYDFPYVIILDGLPIGYIQYCDLDAYTQIYPDPKGVFTEEPQGTLCIDLFIGETEHLNKGIGTESIKQFCQFLFENKKAQRIVVDPAESNLRAIKCYKKIGFSLLRKAYDGVTSVQILELKKDALLNFVT